MLLFWIINSCLVYCYPEHAGCSKFKMVLLTFDFYRFFSKFKIDFEWENFIFWRLMVIELHRDLKIRIFSTFWLELIQNGNQKNVPPLRKHQNTFGAKATTTAHSSNINFHFFSQLDNIWRQLWTLFRQIYGNPRITYSGWLTFFFKRINKHRIITSLPEIDYYDLTIILSYSILYLYQYLFLYLLAMKCGEIASISSKNIKIEAHLTQFYWIEYQK